MGAFDNLKAASVAARPFGCWIHVDGSWGGAAMLSKSHRHLMVIETSRYSTLNCSNFVFLNAGRR